MKLVKHFAFAVLMALFAINTAQAAAPAGTQLTAAISLQGGSSSALKWVAPLTAPYKVHVFVPNTGTATNALYRVYPKGKRATATTCISTDLTYPCYEVSVDQTQHKNAWAQLTLNNDVATQWNFVKAKGFVTAVASNLSTTQMLNLSALVRFENMTQPALKIGQTYQGGIIFYLDATGQHGLIAARTDQGTAKWCNNCDFNGQFVGTTTTGAISTAVGTGQANTTTIINNQGAGVYAAKLCDDLVVGTYSDWYLPSKDELNLMYTNIGQEVNAVAPLFNVGSFGTFNYWSSSEYDNGNAWNQFFDYTPIQQSIPKPFGQISVRAIRAF